jgi:FkbM family methyltransferase
MKAAASYFVNVKEYEQALDAEDGTLVDIRTKDGLTLPSRRNCSDAWVLAEVFLDKSYVQGLVLVDQPTIVDIGGYIGDFALYAAKRLNARRVISCEPSPRNFALLSRNIVNNRYQDRIETVNKAVTDGNPVMMDVDAPDREQVRVSAYGSGATQRTSIPGISLARLVEDHGLNDIDLLKIDCEGGEYDILSSTPTETFARIKNIVFECHEIEGFEAKLTAVKRTLCSEGYSWKMSGSLVTASRDSTMGAAQFVSA